MDAEGQRSKFEENYTNLLLSEGIGPDSVSGYFERRGNGEYASVRTKAAFWGWLRGQEVLALAIPTSQQALSLGERIARLRAASGMTQRELAAKVGVTWSMICKYENGHCTPRKRVLWALEEVLAGEGRGPDE